MPSGAVVATRSGTPRAVAGAPTLVSTRREVASPEARLTKRIEMGIPTVIHLAIQTPFRTPGVEESSVATPLVIEC